MWPRLNQLVNRLQHLEMEAESGAEDRIYVICRAPDESQEAAITRHGITPQPEDTVVFLTMYSAVGCAVCEEQAEAPRALARGMSDPSGAGKAKALDALL